MISGTHAPRHYRSWVSIPSSFKNCHVLPGMGDGLADAMDDALRSALLYALIINVNGVLLGKLSGQVDNASGST